MKTVKPISPSELPGMQAEALPDYVLESVNACLLKTSGVTRTVMQDDVIAEIIRRSGIPRADVFSRKLLDFEDAFRSVGWKVSYWKPGYNEEGRAYFEFTEDAK